MVSADPLGELDHSLGRLDPSHSWRESDASLVDRWSIRSEPSPFLPLEGRLRPDALAQLLLRCRVQLEEHCEEDHSARLLQLHRPKRMEFFQSTGWAWSLTPKAPREVRRPMHQPHA